MIYLKKQLNIKNRVIDYKEIWVEDYLPNSKIEILDIQNLVKKSDIIFVPIQTRIMKNMKASQEYLKRG